VGSEILALYDPMIAKLCVWDTDRERARRRMLRALEEFTIEGVPTLVGFHRALLTHPCFVAGETCHGIAESNELAAQAAELAPQSTGAARDGAPRFRPQIVDVELDGRRYGVTFLQPEPPHAELARVRRERSLAAHHLAGEEEVVSPMQGTVLAVEVADGDEVTSGAVICVVEAMKMENEITAHRDGRVSGLSVEPGQAVSTGQVVCLVAKEDD
jgi:acetyl-CoA/propionyl-CoA carboxylase biotin carboxyl carrier protein